MKKEKKESTAKKQNTDKSTGILNVLSPLIHFQPMRENVIKFSLRNDRDNNRRKGQEGISKAWYDVQSRSKRELI